MKNHFLLTFLLIFTPLSIFSQKPLKIKGLAFSDNFEKGFDTAHWYAELDPRPHNSVSVKNGYMEIDVADGATVWLKHPLSRKWTIEFDRTVVMENGQNDRLSDFNLFWQATDPRGQLFGRNPKLENYDSLSLYYIGFGGNNNTTTRIRKYQGTGEKTILKEYLEPKYLLKPNHTYHCRLVVKRKTFWIYFDDQLIFSYKDPKILRGGYFGFRTTQSRHRISHFRVVF
jgi:Domain of unknown function (DUF6250)